MFCFAFCGVFILQRLNLDGSILFLCVARSLEYVMFDVAYLLLFTRRKGE